MPNKEQIKSLLQDDRDQTDESLTTERGKTDESLQKLKKKTEQETDIKVQSDRDEADIARAAGASPESGNAVELERHLIDKAIQKERDLKEEQITVTLHRERDETDENLMNERNRTDSEMQLSTQHFADERTSHVNTKAELTTRDEFLAIVSHDLRNPIGTISSYADLLLRPEIAGGMCAEAKGWVEVIKRNAESSLRLISDIIDMERISEGKIKMQLVKVDFNLLMEESTKNFKNIAMKKNIQLSIQAVNNKCFVMCDPDRISQIFSNLVGNALKFTPDGGNVSLKLMEKKEEVHISICDSGPGIPEAQRKNIFGRYMQLKEKNREGLGLGLYIAKMLVEAHKGKIWVESAQPKGSNFNFTLPATIRT